MERRRIYLSLAILWTFVIIYLCLISVSNLPKVPGADKGVHFVFHFVFTILWFLYFDEKPAKVKMLNLKIFLTATFFGIAIEIAQELFTTTRSGDVYDALTNMAGSFTAILLLRVFKNKIQN